MKTALVMMRDFSPPRRAVPLPRFMGAWLQASLLRKNRGKGLKNWKERRALVMPHDYHHGGDGAARERIALVKGGFPFRILA